MSTETYALSLEQAHIWTLADPATLRTQVVITRPVAADAHAIATRAAQLAADHEILRTTYAQPAGMTLALQHVHDVLAPVVQSVDGDAATIADAELAAPWDLAVESPLRVVVAADAVVVTLPALAADLESARALADALVGASPSAATDEPLQYADYVQWQVENHEDPDGESARIWWNERVPTTATHLGRSAESRGPRPVGSKRIAVDVADVSVAATAAAARYGASFEDFVEACWLAYIARVGLDDVVALAVRLDGRISEEFDGAVGHFARYAPLTVALDDAPSIVDVMDLLGREREAMRLRDEQLRPDPRTVDGTPLALAVSRQPEANRVHGISDGFACELVVAGAASALFVDPALVDEDTAQRWAAQFVELLRSAAAAPTTPFTDLRLLDARSAAELQQWESGTQTAPSRTVLAAFDACVDVRPDAIAVGVGAERLSYAELSERSTALATALVERHRVVPGSRVGLCTERTTDVLVGILGIWRAGAAYVALNLEHPEARLRSQLEDADVAVVVATPTAATALPATYTVCSVDAAGAPDTVLPSPALSDLAYVMFTSGSTGQPKGVEISHANLANYCDAIIDLLGLDDHPLHTGVVTAISTDLGNTCIFPTLASGGCVEFIPPDDALDPNRFARHVAQWPLDVLKVTPSHLRALLTAGPADVLPSTALLVGGEALSWDLVDIVRANSACRMLNHYGPTETTVGSCTYEIGADHAVGAATVPIGRPIRNTTVDVVDATGGLVPVGVPGELWIGGAGVARGYAARAEETAVRFVADPRRPGNTVYRTGDRVRRRSDGALEFLGRVDDQVKIRGYRVEPREVEMVLLANPQVDEVAVVALGDADDLRLVAYVVSSGYPTPDALKATVTASLPDHMVPAAYVLLSTLPRTASGKIDRRALPSPDTLDSGFGRPFVAPRNDIEAALAACWAEVLRIEQVGVEDDFFELGGHSLLAAQIVARVRQTFAVELPLHSLFTAPTVALLATEVDALRTAALGDEELDDLLAGMTDEEIAALLSEAD